MKSKDMMLNEIEQKATQSANAKVTFVASAIRGIKTSIENRAQVAARYSCRNLKITAFEISICNDEDSTLDKDNELIRELTKKYVETFAHKIAEGLQDQKDIKIKCGKIENSKFPPDIKFFIEM